MEKSFLYLTGNNSLNKNEKKKNINKSAVHDSNFSASVDNDVTTTYP